VMITRDQELTEYRSEPDVWKIEGWIGVDDCLHAWSPRRQARRARQGG